MINEDNYAHKIGANEDISRQIIDSDSKSVISRLMLRGADFYTKFCLEHRVEVIMDEDGSYLCLIDYKKDEGVSAWSVQSTSLICMLHGIDNYLLHKGNENKRAIT